MSKMEKGKYVNRSTFQKVAEENKKLRAHIAILVEEGMPSFEKIQLVKTYRDKIAADKKLMQEIREVVKSMAGPYDQCEGAKCKIENCPVCKNEMY